VAGSAGAELVEIGVIGVAVVVGASVVKSLFAAGSVAALAPGNVPPFVDNPYVKEAAASNASTRRFREVKLSRNHTAYHYE
jgi:hypothetical protein